MTRFEDRHRELREAERVTKARSLGLPDEHITAVEAVDGFEERTGPLVDDLVAAVRRLTEAEDMDADKALQGIYVALAALDEASGRG